MEIFKFDKDDVTRHIEYELKTLEKFKEPLKYVTNELTRLGHGLKIKSLDTKFNMNKVKELEGKNYHWSVFTFENATLVIRRYRYHLTVFTKVEKPHEKYPKTEYGAFTINTDMDRFGDKHDEMMDVYYEEPFTDLQVIAKDLFELMTSKNGGVHWVWNSVSLKRPKHVDIKLIFSGNSISSIDDFVFCMEELSQMFLELFSETVTLKMIKNLKSGDMFDERYTIGRVSTVVKDDYYHGVGVELFDGKKSGNSGSFQDVYSLTRWYFKDVFKNKIYIHDGVVYIEGGKLKDGCVVAYKNMEDSTTVYKSTYPKENFIPLKKY